MISASQKQLSATSGWCT